MKYRAVLTDSGNKTTERVVQIFGDKRGPIDEWAQDVLKHAVAPDAFVEVYETSEQRIAIVPKPRPTIEAKAEPAKP
jgi:hypothetical protein